LFYDIAPLGINILLTYFMYSCFTKIVPFWDDIQYFNNSLTMRITAFNKMEGQSIFW